MDEQKLPTLVLADEDGTFVGDRPAFYFNCRHIGLRWSQGMKLPPLTCSVVPVTWLA